MNKLIVAVLFLQCLAFIKADVSKRDSIVDKGDHVLKCSQEPIEFGIVLDSSSSIDYEDFQKAKKFLVTFIDQFDVGVGHNDVRVSIITFGKGIYPQDAFNLTTYDTKEGVLTAISNMPHHAVPYTDTGKAIRFMHNHQLAQHLTRSYAEKICLVVTDGNSQRWTLTRSEATLARNDNITMFALGIGSERQVGMQELVRIAGDDERVTRVDNYDHLDAIKGILAKKTCIRKEKPATTPMAMTQSCGQANPADIEFIFSPADLGLDASTWTTSFISNTIATEDIQEGFRYGVKAGVCPDDEGFNLDLYEDIGDISEHLLDFDKLKLPSLISYDLFDESRGGRPHARDVAVLFATGAHVRKGTELQERVKELLDNNVQVFVANPAGYPINIEGAIPLKGRSSRRQSEALIDYLCPNGA